MNKNCELRIANLEVGDWRLEIGDLDTGLEFEHNLLGERLKERA